MMGKIQRIDQREDVGSMLIMRGWARNEPGLKSNRELYIWEGEDGLHLQIDNPRDDYTMAHMVVYKEQAPYIHQFLEEIEGIDGENPSNRGSSLWQWILSFLFEA